MDNWDSIFWLFSLILILGGVFLIMRRKNKQPRKSPRELFRNDKDEQVK